MKRLAYFERPQRRMDIGALANRAVAIDAEVRADSELDRLRRSAPRHARAAETKAAPGKAIGRRASGALVAAVAWFLVGIAVTGWYLNRPTPDPPDAPPAGAAVEGGTAAEGTAPSEAPPPSGVSGLVSVASEALNSAAIAGLRAIGLAAPAEDGAKPPAAPPSAVRKAPAGGARSSSATSATSPESASVVPPAVAAAPTAPELVPLVPVAAEPVEATAAPTPVFFSDIDSDVQPPVLVYPQLPEPPSSSIAPGQAYFEILVNEGGTVERVRLMAAQARFQDRMMVSAAKAWRFKPATKEGESVRCLLKVPTTQTPEPQ